MKIIPPLLTVFYYIFCVAADDFCSECIQIKQNLIVTKTMELLCVTDRERRSHDIKYSARTGEQCEFIRSILTIYYGSELAREILKDKTPHVATETTTTPTSSSSSSLSTTPSPTTATSSTTLSSTSTSLGTSLSPTTTTSSTTLSSTSTSLDTSPSPTKPTVPTSLPTSLSIATSTISTILSTIPNSPVSASSTTTSATLTSALDPTTTTVPSALPAHVHTYENIMKMRMEKIVERIEKNLKRMKIINERILKKLTLKVDLEVR